MEGAIEGEDDYQVDWEENSLQHEINTNIEGKSFSWHFLLCMVALMHGQLANIYTMVVVHMILFCRN